MGIRIQAGTHTDPIDLTFDPSIFRPLAGEEWVKVHGDQQEANSINVVLPSSTSVKSGNPFDTSLMTAYVSPRASQLEDEGLRMPSNEYTS